MLTLPQIETAPYSKNMNGLEKSSFSKMIFRPVKLGVVNLVEADELMKMMMRFRASEAISDVLLLLSHEPVLSYGARKLNLNDFLAPMSYFEGQSIPLVQTQRGGGLTYHWEGQLNVYPILKLQKNEQNLSNYMFRLEEVAIRTLADLGVVAHRKREKVAQIGLWVGNRKVASMGTYVSNWITSYGFAMNLGGDYRPANSIKPCGLDVKLCTVEEIIGKSPDKDYVSDIVIRHFSDIFGRRIAMDTWQSIKEMKFPNK